MICKTVGKSLIRYGAPALALLVLMSTTSNAASVQSVDCSSSSIEISFDGTINSTSVTKVEMGRGESPRVKYELDLLPGTIINGTRLKLTPDSTALGRMRKVAPWKAYIFVSGNSSGSAKCNS